MCGLVGAFMLEGKLKIGEKQRKDATIMLVTELMQLTRIRGKDATGVTTLFDDGRYICLKMGVEVTDFIGRFGETETDYDGFLKLLREDKERMRVFLGHCRKSSVGNTWDNANNHPIKVGEIVGIHNGTLSNHEQIFDNLKCERSGEVDSEAIFRLLNHYTNDGKDPFTPEIIQETAKRLHGNYSVLGYNGNNPYQAIAFRDGRPLEMVLVKPLNIILVASEKVFLQRVLFRLAKSVNLYKVFPKSLHISDKSLDFKMLIDDSLAIFDLTQEITESTKIDDLFHWEKIPRNDKLWAKPTTPTVYGNSNNNSHKTAWQKQQDRKKDIQGSTSTSIINKTDKTEVFSKSIKDIDKKPGFVYNKELKSYMNENPDPKDKKKGSVEINTTVTGEISDLDIDNDNIIDITGTQKKTFELEPKDNLESLVSSEAKIKEVKIEDTTEVLPIVPPNIETKIAEVKEINTETDTEAIELAESFAKELKKFKNDDELVAGIELDNNNVLIALKPHSLANRVAAFASRFAFYNGFMAGKIKAEPITIGPETVSKSLSSVRRFKLMTMKLAAMIDEHPTGEAVKGRIIDKGVKEILSTPSTGITPETLKQMYSAGDLRNSFTIRRVMSVVKEGNSKDVKKEKTNSDSV